VVAPAESPFDTSGIEVGTDGIRRYTDLKRNVVALLKDTVDRFPERTAVVELGGTSVTYAQLWERARRVAGGLRDAGV
jgi:long-chain acyl-CoA synthetase